MDNAVNQPLLHVIRCALKKIEMIIIEWIF